MHTHQLQERECRRAERARDMNGGIGRESVVLQAEDGARKRVSRVDEKGMITWGEGMQKDGKEYRHEWGV